MTPNEVRGGSKVDRRYPRAATGARGPQLGHIVADHRALRRETNELLVLAEHGLEVDRVLSHALVDRLSRLCDRLRVHFELEERGGYMHEVRMRRPELQIRITHLERQHASFLDEGAELMRCLLGAPPPRNATARVVRMLEAIRDHEIAEHDLIQEAFADDFGSGE